MKFFAQKESEPLFVPIEEIDRRKVDLSLVAKEIVDKDMRRKDQEIFINSLWDDETGLIRIYFGKKYFYKRQLETEIDKIFNPEQYTPPRRNITFIDRSCEELTIYEILKACPDYAKKLKEGVYSKAIDDDGKFFCAKCGKKSATKALFHIDHIKPMKWGGLSVPENLQLLCRTCNWVKSDKQ